MSPESRIILSSSGRAKPVHDFETVDAFERANIIRNKRGTDRESVRGDQHVAGADRRPTTLQLGAQASIMGVGIVLERTNWNEGQQ